MKKYQFISLAVLVLLWIGSTHYMISKIPEKVTANMLAIEYNKVGWMENYVKINEIQKKQIISWLKQYEAQNWKVNPPNKIDNSSKSNPQKKFSLKQVKKITWEKTHILGNKNAEISWVEYSDMECPYCKKLHDSWAIEKALKEYDWKVNFIFKQFPVHSPMKAAANICAGKLGWTEKYYDFIDKIYTSNAKTKNDVSEIAWSLWIDKIKFISCIDSKDIKDLVSSQSQEAQQLWITWTPWNIIINNKTGKWTLIPWAYPYESFKQNIDSLFSE
jgi:protein-disulfide isomerase